MSDEFNLDMSMMFAVHDALRRDLVRIARIAAKLDGDPRQVLRTAAGWEMFKSFLRVHHTSEDITVWAVLEPIIAGRTDDMAVLAAMEAEHAAIDPLLAAVDAVLADREGISPALADVVDALITGLSGHLRHEETAGLRLVDANMTPEQWKAFSDDHRARIGPDANRYLPWLLDDASPEAFASVMRKIPEPLRHAYETEWRAAYADLRPWNARPEQAAA